MYQVNRITYSTTGAKTITLGGPPKLFRVTLGGRFGTTDNYSHITTFAFDGTNLICTSAMEGRTESPITKLSHWAKISGVNTEVVNATNFAFSGNDITFTVNTANINYQWLIETDY